MERYGYDQDTKKYKGKIRCQIDPLESEIAKKTIWLKPANTTDVEPPEEKDGFDIVWNVTENRWEYQEQKKDPEPEPYEPTELDKAQAELWDAQNNLAQSDWIGSKIDDARNWGTEAEVHELLEKYRPVYEDRKVWREQVRTAERKIEELTASTEEQDGDK